MAVTYKVSSLSLALGELARLFAEKPVGSCEISWFVCMYYDSIVGPVPEHPPMGGGVIFIQAHQGIGGHAWWMWVGEDVLLQSAWTLQEKQHQMF